METFVRKRNLFEGKKPEYILVQGLFPLSQIKVKWKVDTKLDKIKINRSQSQQIVGAR